MARDEANAYHVRQRTELEQLLACKVAAAARDQRRGHRLALEQGAKLSAEAQV